MLPLTQLRTYERNAKVHPPKQIGRIAESIRSFGFIVPIVVDADATIIAGHGRFEAAKLFGLTKVPVLRVTHLTDAQVRGYRIADNKLAEGARWDDDLLRIEVEGLMQLETNGDLTFDMSTLGFDTAELDILLDPRPDRATADPIDDVPDLPEGDVAARLGDLWALGQHRVLCGNALDSVAHDRLMSGDLAQMVFTDPPYNVRIHGHVRSHGSHAEFAMASGEMSASEFQAFLRHAVDQMTRMTRDGAVIFICMDWRHLQDLHVATSGAGLAQLNLVVWAKTNAGMGSLYRSQHELIGVYRSPRSSHTNNVQLGRFGRSRSNVWTYAGVNTFGRSRAADLRDHPTVKPVAMIEDAIRDVTHRGEIVLDPFGGAGSTLLAAERCRRRARLIELEPRYVEVAIRRWEKLTGETAVELGSGKTIAERRRKEG
jgi:DNA modification methylase